MMKCLFTVVILSWISVATAADDPTRKPNVLFIVVDDLNKYLPCYGHPEVKAPNVDRLAAKATRFDRAYCQYPVCSPSRVSFLSGRRPEHTGVYGNAGVSRTPLLKDAVFLQEHFRANGYFTARVGKVFNLGRDVAESWNVTEEGTPDGKVIFGGAEIEKLGLAGKVTSSGRLAKGGGERASWSILEADDDLIDARAAKRVAELIDGAVKGDKPFLIACGFRRPHLPRIAPARYYAQYPLDKIALPPQSPVVHPRIKAPPSEKDTREALRSYFACTSFMDAQLGIVLDALDRGKLWDNTVVVFIGDHGYSLGGRGGWWGKNTGYDESCSTAMLIHAPGQQAGAECKRVVEFLDLYPTLVDLCGLPLAKGLEGRSIKPLLEDPMTSWDRPAFSVLAANNKPVTLAVSTERFRLIRPYDGDGPVELYDVQADPNEWKNLSTVPEFAADLARINKLAEEYLEQMATPRR